MKGAASLSQAQKMVSEEWNHHSHVIHWETHHPASLNSVPQTHILIPCHALEFLELLLTLLYLRHIPFSFCIASPLLPRSLVTSWMQPKWPFSCAVWRSWLEHWPAFLCLPPQPCFLKGHPWWSLASNIFPQRATLQSYQIQIRSNIWLFWLNHIHVEALITFLLYWGQHASDKSTEFTLPVMRGFKATQIGESVSPHWLCISCFSSFS